MNLIRQILAISAKEFKILWQDRQALVLLFLMPAFFILVMSSALEGVFEAGTRDRPLEVLLLNRDAGKAAGETIADLKELEGLSFIETHEGASLDPEKAERLVREGEFGFALVFPHRYTEEILRPGTDITGKASKVLLFVDPTIPRPIAANVRGTIQGVLERRRLAVQLPERWRNFFQPPQEQAPFEGFPFEGPRNRVKEGPGAGPFSMPSSGEEALEIRYPGDFEKSRKPTATEQNVPAYAIFGVFFIVLTLARGVLKERTDGTFLRLLSAPLPKIAILIGKLLPYYVVNLVQIVLMFAVGVLIFQMRLGSLGALFLISLSLAAAATGLGLLVAALGRTESQVDTLSVLLAVSLSALGGMMVPVFVMPKIMQKIALVTPHAWALQGYHDAIVRGLGAGAVLTEAAVLMGFALVFFSVALWRFRFR
jgi:ABC-2 type transport system permease protein